MKRKAYVKKRHKLFFKLARPIGKLIGKIYGFKYEIFPLKKGENYLILSNHQTTMDPPLLAMSFKAPVYMMANDSLFNSSIPSKLLRYCFAPIKKKKATVDVGCIKNCIKVAKEGGNIAIFPEGNRAWADFQFYIDPSICRLVELLKLPVLIYNFSGGYGVDPRWSKTIRKGKFTGKVREIITLEEIEKLDKDELYSRIVNGLRVIDSESNELYKSDKRAEFLERELFICPNCENVSTLTSDGNYFSCSKCGLKVEYGEDLRLKCENEGFKFERLVDWYKYQIDEVKKFKNINDEIIFRDKNVAVFDKSDIKRFEISNGELILTDKFMQCGDFFVQLSKIKSASIVGGVDLIIYTEDKSYLLVGNQRFNPIKYMLLFNILDTGIRKEKYYGLEI